MDFVRTVLFCVVSWQELPFPRILDIAPKLCNESRKIYEIVWRMQMAALEAIKPGVAWEDVHMHAHNIAVDGLWDSAFEG